jgi:DNA-directed RNA polymerase subunit RPC12/RpoP
MLPVGVHLVSSLAYCWFLYVVLLLTLTSQPVTNQLSVWFVTDESRRWQDQLSLLDTKDLSSRMSVALHDSSSRSQRSIEINCEHFNSATRFLLSSGSVSDVWNYASTKTLGSFPCVSCGRQYRRRKALMAHVKYECGKAPQFQCPYCSHRFTQNSSLRVHLRRKHPSFWHQWYMVGQIWLPTDY